MHTSALFKTGTAWGAPGRLGEMHADAPNRRSTRHEWHEWTAFDVLMASVAVCEGPGGLKAAMRCGFLCCVDVRCGAGSHGMPACPAAT